MAPTVDHDRVPEGVTRVRADNPSPLTLDGTNTYLVAGWVVDPGPDDASHRERILAAAPGGLEGIVLTHDHPDHAEGAPALAAQAGGLTVHRPREGDAIGPFAALATPGHAPDHVCLLWGTICFSGDAVLGAGSVFVAPATGAAGSESAMGAYLRSLRRLRELDLEVICPGHGPIVTNPRAKLDEYVEHRLARERALLAALEAGARTESELLDRAWSDVPCELRPAAAVTLRAHLEKLDEEGRLPEESPARGYPRPPR
jgi:glyoxylase-like metal-dependent hydrolase (beta-lactamase superfamily II)